MLRKITASWLRLPAWVVATSFCVWGSNSLAQEARPAAAAPAKVDSAQEIFSGPQVGEAIGEAHVWVVPPGDKPSEKQDLQTLAEQGPIAIAFMHEKVRPAFGLARLMSEYATQLKDTHKIQLLFVVLSEDRSSSENWLRLIRKNFKAPTQLAVADGGIEGPGSLGLNRKVVMTILVAKDAKVTANFALTQVTDKVDGPKILKAMSEAAGAGDPPAIGELMPNRRR